MTRPQLCHECNHPVTQHGEAHGCRAQVVTYGTPHPCLCYLTPEEAASPPGAQPEQESV